MPLETGGIVARTGLVPRLRQAMTDAPVVVVCAPAGSGKTWSLVQALRNAVPDAPQPFWLSLDEGDTLQRVVLALAHATEAADLPWRQSISALAEMLEQDETGPLRVADATTHVMAMAEITSAVLVLDDLHRVRDPAVFRWLDRLIEHLPPNWTLILSSRIDPPIALARLRAQGRLAEFRARDLAFSDTEVAALIAQHHGGEADPALAHSICARTNGWAAGCSLAARADGLADSPVLIRSAFEFLSSEVLDLLPAELRRFLMRCAILPELDGRCAAAVTGDAEADRWLAEIERRELFCVVLSVSPRVLRLHDLLRETLIDRLQRELPEEIPELYRRAAGCEADPERRIGYLLRAQAFTEAEAEVAIVAPELILQGLREAVARIAESFPPDFRAASPVLAYVCGLSASSHSVWPEARRHMLAAAEGFSARGALHQANRARAHVAVCCVGLGLAEEAATICRSLRAAPQDIETQTLTAMASYWLAKIHGAAADELAEFDALVDALLRSDDPALWNHCALHLHLAGRLGMGMRCERYASAALAIAEEHHSALRDSALCMRVWNRLLSGDTAQASPLIDALDQDHYWGEKPFPVRTTVLLFRTLLAALRQDAPALLEHNDRHLAEFDGREGPSWVYWRSLTLSVRGKLMLALGEIAEVERVVRELDAALRLMPAPILRIARAYLVVGLALRTNAVVPPLADAELLASTPYAGDVIGIEPAGRALSVLCHARRGETAVAQRELAELIEVSQATGDIMHLMLLGSETLDALRRLAGADAPAAAFLGGLIARLREIARAARDDGTASGPDLSPREMEVLSRLARGDSNKVIAREFDLSPHTVKRHVANILEKLALSSRGQAAAWFRENVTS